VKKTGYFIQHLILSLIFIFQATTICASPSPVKVGIYQNSPKIFVDSSGNPSGFFADLLNDIAAKEEWKLEYVPCVWKECLQKLEQGQLDIMIDVAYSGARELRFDFNREVVISSWSIVFQKTGENIDSIVDLDNRNIAVLKESIQYKELKERANSFGISPVYVEADSFNRVLQLIDQNKADFALLNRFYGSRHKAQHNLEPTNILVRPAVVKFAFPKNSNSLLIQGIDRQLVNLKQQKNSSYYRAIDKWLLVPEQQIPPWVEWMIGVLSLLVFILFTVVLLSRTIIRRKTSELIGVESLLKSAINSTPDLIFFKDKQGVYLGCNSAYEKFSGKKHSEIVGKTSKDLYDQELSERIRKRDKNVLESGLTRQDEERVTYPDGKMVLLDTLKTPFYDSDKNIIGVLGISRDITQRKKIERELIKNKAMLDRMAHHDTLTELPNRLLFIDRLNQAIHTANRNNTVIALLFIDLDNFKEINDSLGHSVGDELLQAVSRRLTQATREDDIISRLGGDEFTVITGELKKPEDAAIVAQKMVNEFQQPFALKNHQLHITASIGISTYPDNGTDVENLLKNADSAMYRAKHEGRNTYHFYIEDMTLKAIERIQMESDLRTAIRENQFTLQYQPLYELKSRKLIGSEALIRWSHPQKGLISPVKFIPLAEETGLIREIGEWVINKVCSSIKIWIEDGYQPVRIAINVSGKQLIKGSHSLFDTMQRIINDTQCDPRLIGLEITEGLVMHSPEQSIKDFTRLQELGIEISIDDFGTGYSSLSNLKKLPINKLKIDRSFIRDIPDYPNDQAISRAIIAMGKSLQLTVLAEGVENKVQQSFLEQEGCHEVQGFYYSKPLAEEDYLKLLKKSG